MSDEREFYIWSDGAPVGPFSLPQIHAKMAAGELTGATLANFRGAIQWTPLEDLLKLEAEAQATPRPAERDALVPVRSVGAISLPPADVKRNDVVPMSSVLLDLCIVLVFITGAGLAAYFWFVFDTAPKGMHNTGLLNDRVVGVGGGFGLMVVGLLAKICRLLKLRSGRSNQ